MNRVQNTKSHSLEKHFPGCLGRMVNLFDLANNVSGNRLLTSKPHNGSSLSRSQSDVVRMMGAPFGDQIEDKMIVSEFQRSSSNKKASGTPMKTLIAQELSREVDSNQKPPNLVAKLMGLDALPHQQPDSGALTSHTKGYSRRSLSHSGILLECWESDQNFSDKEMQCSVHHCPEQNECKDTTYEVWQQCLTKELRDGSPQKRRPDGNMNDRKMALIRQKFMELKFLATDEKGRKSKEFQEALDILSSNRDLLLKFFQEPNSIFSQHLYDMLSVPPPPETKRITVLRPSSKVAASDKMAGLEKKVDKKTTEPAQMNQATAAWDNNNFGCSPTFSNDEYSSVQPTRIVVLKPSPARTYDIKAVISPPLPTPRGEELNGEAEDHEAQESRDVASEIAMQMCKDLVGRQRDETLLSSDVFSNGYIGDDSSFDKSEIEDPTGNLSDSEIASPISRHSWDYVNRFGSPYSSSSFSRASCTPESSVCREAKKRLSERWALMSSNMSLQQENNARRSSSTLGEMLALSDTKKPVVSKEEPDKNEQELEASTSSLACNQTREDGIDQSPRSLLRSKSLPVSSSIYGVRLNVEISDSEAVKVELPKELTRTKSMKSSLKGKVSSLFFSKNKKPKDQNSASQSVTTEVPLPRPGQTGSHRSSCIHKTGMEQCCSPSLDGSCESLKQGVASHEGVLTVAKPEIARSTSENQDQPSPISVLEAQFDEDDLNIPELCASIKLDRRGPELLSKSNLIDKSPPIESIARTLSWDDSSCAETTASSSSSYSLKPSSAEEEERDLLSFMDTLLSVAGLGGQSQMEMEDSNFPRWHSPQSPLDPSLRDKLASETDKEVAVVHEAKRRQIRSSRKLVFDCLNLALSDIIITSHGPTAAGRESLPAMEAVENVLSRLREWVGRRDDEEEGDSGSSVVERVVRKEVAGKGWIDGLATEVESVGKEIEGKLLEELVEEAVVDLASS
ncbi:unnamed protein product [Linum tenue]|uniref:DUF4378 domain-containing protein n=1 Tax=Linum tenue TaxID=586396 RepID=A0AAV0I8Q2_9ROSI|nr:unnamed protein product [Linum tenue]